MAAISRISITIQTGDIDGAGTDGDVYLGICGREFKIDAPGDDFERGSTRVFRLGDAANILNEERNDPRNPQLDSDDLDKYPVYIRFEPLGENPDWNLRSVNVEVGETGYGIIFLHGLWLGQMSGKFCYLKEGRFGE